MKTVKTFGNLAEAGFASSLLESAGIRTFLADEANFQWNPGLAMNGIRLQVEEEDFALAEKLLAEGPSAQAAPEDTDPALAETESAPPETAASENRTGGGIPVKLFVAVAVLFVVLFLALKLFRQKREATASESMTYDYNGDGRPDYVVNYRNGYPTTGQNDRNYDGKMDEWYTFDAEGRVETQRTDDNFDGRADVWIVYAKGQIVSTQRDADYDGIPDWFGTFQNGLPLREECRPKDSSNVLGRYIYEHGRLREEWRDEDRDGNFDFKILYDPFGGASERIPVRPGE